MNQQTNCPLFLVPSEVRSRIYEYYLAFTHADFADTLRPTHLYLEAAAPHATPLPALMLTCRRAYADLGPDDVHATAALRVRRLGSSDRRIGFAVRGVLRLERLRRLVLVVDMDYANWNAWLDFWGAVLGRTPELRHLVLDWGPRPDVVVVAAAAPAREWQRRQTEKKEGVFFRLLNGIDQLQTLRVYGQVPAHWERMIEQNTKATVVRFPYRWWKEVGFD
ncbi:hypothetical protein F4778DRAFT_794673 [Xylariomycetidae sp. FL2044]|nr:hypothetical protein F4778DRAFT_794673 [Xylariomycetidae sp. FL2044]